MRLLICIILVFITIAAYCRVMSFGYVNYDDNEYIIHNRHIHDGLTQESVVWAFTTSRAVNWHPLTWISYMLDVQFYGNHSWGYHLTNLLFHLANTLLLFLLLLRMTGNLWASAFVAAAFAVHPLHVESVAWVSERKDVLSTFFWMLTMWAYVTYVNKPAFRRYLIMLVWFALGLMSKPMLVTLPFVLLLLDHWPLERCAGAGKQSTWRHLVFEKLPMFVMAAASCVITVMVQKSGGAVQLLQDYPFGVRLANAVVSYTAYITKMLWPTKLCILYPHPETSLPLWHVLISTALLVVLTSSALLAARRRPYITMGWLWYVVTLIPVIGLVQVGQQAMADRYTYVPLIGLFIIIAWGIPDMTKRFKAKILRYVPAVGASIIILILIIMTYFQTGCWRSEMALFKQAMSATSGHCVIRCCIAGTLLDQGKPKQAIDQLKTAIKMNPSFARGHNALGFIYLKQGKLDAAIKELNRALKINPDFPLAHSNIGSAYATLGKTDEAIRHFKKAIKMKPNYSDTHYSLANVLVEQGMIDEGIAEYRQALRYNPDMAKAHCKLASVLITLGRVDEAELHLRLAQLNDPKMADAYFYLGCLMQKQGNIQGALEQITEVIKLDPNFGPAHNAMAVLLFQCRDFDGARKEVEITKSLGCPVSPRLEQALSQH
ncbi:tetratricopeptide repeat protein [bacterium]|nr:tetratricopeptide repeat protein [bacterium]